MSGHTPLLDRLRVAAAAVNACRAATGFAPRVSLTASDAALVAELGALDGARRSTVVYTSDGREPPYAIEAADIEVDGIGFRAQFSRPATSDELQRFEVEGVHITEGQPFRAVHVAEGRAS